MNLETRPTCFILTKQDTSATKLSFVLYFSDYYLNIRIGYGTGGVSWEDHTFGTLMVTGRWYHFAATFDDSTKAYLLRIWDDTASALLGTDLTGTATNNIYVGDGTMYIGARNGANQTYDGLLDELVYFNDILSTAEIDAIRAGTYVGGASSVLPLISVGMGNIGQMDNMRG
jgi:hypothetical protein